MPLTDYVTLGRSGLRVSPFCLGAMTFGEDWGWGSTPAESAAILGRVLGHARVEDRGSADARAAARRDAGDGDSGVVFARRTNGRRRSAADGARVRTGRDAVVAAGGRRAVGQVHARFGEDRGSRRSRH